MSTLGERLRLAREKKGMKQTQVKDRTNINNKTLSGYENNVSEPDSNTLSTLADLYEVSYRWLLSGKGEMLEKAQPDTPYTAPLTKKDEQDIARRLKEIEKDIEQTDGLAFDGEPFSKEAQESFLEAMEYIVRTTKKINKKYTPTKYRKGNKDE